MYGQIQLVCNVITLRVDNTHTDQVQQFNIKTRRVNDNVCKN